MNFDDIQKIKNSAEIFNNVQLYSVLENNKVLIQNSKTQAIFEIGYEYNEDENIIFNTSNVKEVSKPITYIENPAIHEFKENCNSLTDGISNIFIGENIDDSITELKNIIKSLPFVDEKNINEELNTTKDNDDIEYSKWINDVFGKKLSKYQETEQDFKSYLNIFDENDEIIKNKFYNLNEIKETLNELSEAYEAFKNDIKKYPELKDKVSEIFESNTLADDFFKQYDMQKQTKVGVTKTLTSMKQNHDNETDFNIRETAKKIVNLMESEVGPKVPFVYNKQDGPHNRPKFFKFKMGIFAMEDVKIMMEELQHYMSFFGDINEEDLSKINEMKMRLEYMYHSGQINDHLIVEMLNEFNSKYAKDKSDEYNNSAIQLAWKDQKQMKLGNAQGMA